jgi:hypothetical protein
LREAVGWPLEGRSVWEVRYLPRLTLFIPVQEVVSLAVGSASADVLAVKLLDHLEEDPARNRLCEALARLAVSRNCWIATW